MAAPHISQATAGIRRALGYALHDLIHGSTPVEKRLGTISIILEKDSAPVAHVNELISQFGDCVVGRLGLPYPNRGVNIITLIVDASIERVSALTGKLGQLPGIQVKSLMSKATQQGAVHHDDPSGQ
jgi:putative iron-only hydrogenase system regulator